MQGLYQIAGVSRQAAHKHNNNIMLQQTNLNSLMVEVDLLRAEHPGCGIEKMYDTLKPSWIGRDKFIDVFMELGYRVKRKRSYTVTTKPSKTYYPNYIEGMTVTNINMIWQSDITYYKVGDSFYYVVFIEDVYSRRIIGYKVSNHMRAEANLFALNMAFKSRAEDLVGLIHHSDRGSQYIDAEYRSNLTNKGLIISQGHKAQDNAYVERVNGIIKDEYLKYREIYTLMDLKREVKRAVNNYNSKRIHRSLPAKQSPEQFEKQLITLNPAKRSIEKIYSKGNNNKKKDFNSQFKPKEISCHLVKKNVKSVNLI
jgi:putative transposase